MAPHDSLPFRPCVATMVLNRDGLVFIGRRTEGPEHVDLTHVWQMPQGGIDKGEDPWPAALRGLYEETSIKPVKKPDEHRKKTNGGGGAWGARPRRGGGGQKKQGGGGFFGGEAEKMVRARVHR